jgi:hypothetical protein
MSLVFGLLFAPGGASQNRQSLAGNQVPSQCVFLMRSFLPSCSNLWFLMSFLIMRVRQNIQTATYRAGFLCDYAITGVCFDYRLVAVACSAFGSVQIIQGVQADMPASTTAAIIAMVVV